MAYSRKPITISNNSTVGTWVSEINAAITKQNELFNASNQFAPEPGAILESPTISGGLIDGATLSGVTFPSAELFSSKLWSSRVINPTISGGTQDSPSISTPSLANPTVSGNLGVTGNVEITDTGWGIFPNRLGAGRVPNHADGSTLQVDGGMVIQDGVKQLNASNDVTNVWYVSGPEDINIVRNFNNDATLWSVRAKAQVPTSGDAEATLALVRTDDAGNEEFMDVFNNGYHTVSSGVEYGIRIQKRGTGEYRDFAIQYHDGVAAVEDVMRINASGLSVNFDKEVTVLARRVVTVSSGVVFPGTPGFGDEVYRSDLDEWYKYNGSVWTQI